jgi:hypothetical protein
MEEIVDQFVEQGRGIVTPDTVAMVPVLAILANGDPIMALSEGFQGRMAMQIKIVVVIS